MARMLWQGKDDAKYEEILEQKILPHVSSKFHHCVWQQHMILWLLRKPQQSVRVLLPNDEMSRIKEYEMSDAPEVHAFICYLRENEIVKSVRQKE
eukprot:884297_1